jgi:hypothetical protein
MVQPKSLFAVLEFIRVSVRFLIGCENLRALHLVEKLLDLSPGEDLADPRHECRQLRGKVMVVFGGLDETEQLLVDQVPDRIVGPELFTDILGRRALVNSDLVELDRGVTHAQFPSLPEWTDGVRPVSMHRAPLAF